MISDQLTSLEALFYSFTLITFIEETKRLFSSPNLIIFLLLFSYSRSIFSVTFAS